MNPLEAFGQMFGCNVSRPSDWLWAIEENARNRYFMRKRDGDTPRAQAYSSRVEGAVAVIPIRGVMVKEPYYDDEVSTIAIRRAVDEAAGNPSVKAIMLLADSPGGSVAGLEELGDAVDAAGKVKRVVTQVDGMCCSAMYELACHTSAIYAGRDHIVGSIGTRLHVFDWSKFAENLGIESVPIDTGEFKSTGAWGTKLSDNQRAYLQEIVDAFQVNFTSTVQRGRKMTAEQVELVATGRVWTGSQAVGLSLTDGVQKPSETMAQLSAAAPQQSTRRITMSHEAAPEAPQKSVSEMISEQRAAIEKACPGAPAEFVNANLEKTPEQASQAWMQQLAADRDAANQRAEDAEKKAAQPAGVTAPKKAGNAPLNVAASGDETAANYPQMARQLAKEKGVSYRQACHMIQKRHGSEAREAFKRPSLGDV